MDLDAMQEQKKNGRSPKDIKCFNCQWNRHIVKECQQPKRERQLCATKDRTSDSFYEEEASDQSEVISLQDSKGRLKTNKWYEYENDIREYEMHTTELLEQIHQSLENTT